MIGEEELATGLELIDESAKDLDLSRFAFCKNFWSFDEECGETREGSSGSGM